MNNFKRIEEQLLWNAFLSVVDALTLIPQSYALKISDWKNWNNKEYSTFIHLLREYSKVDNSIWDNIGFPPHWKEEYLYLWVYITNLPKKKIIPLLRSELQSDLELYND
jgi:hypothetical protein